MSPEELNKLITTDRYFQFERDIVEDGLHFIVCDQGVYDALKDGMAKREDYFTFQRAAVDALAVSVGDQETEAPKDAV